MVLGALGAGRSRRNRVSDVSSCFDKNDLVDQLQLKAIVHLFYIILVTVHHFQAPAHRQSRLPLVQLVGDIQVGGVTVNGLFVVDTA